ncbi:MAG: hypothetical protein J7513_14750 [Solirubrobacteraceae bacterium]|nr:hypothetical protein [Solirubrobacteraceae bacterium]
MPDALFDDLPILGELGATLTAAMARAEATAGSSATAAAPPRRWRRPYGWLGTFLVLGLVGTTAAAGTLTVLRGSPIPGPKAEDTQPSMVQRSDSQHVLGLRANDPAAGHLPFAIRVGESEQGDICATVGQVDGDDFGIVGEDGRFRQLPAGIVDSCGRATGTDVAVAGARVLDAKRYEDVRTVIYGAGADDLKRAEILVRGKAIPLKIEDGAFVGVVPNYPEDIGLQLRLRIGDRTVTHGFGTGRALVLDPSGPAWQMSRGGSQSRDRKTQVNCANLQQVHRADGTRMSSTPPVCFRAPVEHHKLPQMPVPVTYNARTFHTGDRSHDPPGRSPSVWRWQAPSRTVVWGQIDGKRVKQIDLVAPSSVRQRVRKIYGDSFGVVLPASVNAKHIRLLVTMRDGSTRTYSRPVVPTSSMRP